MERRAHVERQALFGDVAVADVAGKYHRSQEIDHFDHFAARRERVACKGLAEWRRQIPCLGLEFAHHLDKDFVEGSGAVVVWKGLENFDVGHGLLHLNQHAEGADYSWGNPRSRIALEHPFLRGGAGGAALARAFAVIGRQVAGFVLFS